LATFAHASSNTNPTAAASSVIERRELAVTHSPSGTTRALHSR
jgi:hypothetical protein